MPRREAEYIRSWAITYSRLVSTMPRGAIHTPQRAMKTAETRANPEYRVFEVMRFQILVGCQVLTYQTVVHCQPGK